MTFAGTCAPVVTPLGSDGSLDEATLRANVERYMRSSQTDIVVLGSHGKAPQLDDDEADRAIAAARQAPPAVITAPREPVQALGLVEEHHAAC